jgi:hypothetical protein
MPGVEGSSWARSEVSFPSIDRAIERPLTSKLAGEAEVLQLAGSCLSLVGLKFPRSGHRLADGVATITSDQMPISTPHFLPSFAFSLFTFAS